MGGIAYAVSPTDRFTTYAPKSDNHLRSFALG